MNHRNGEIPGSDASCVAQQVRRCLLIAAALGWTLMLISETNIVLPNFCSVRSKYLLDFSWTQFESLLLLNSPSTFVLQWMLMLLAMMPPSLIRPLTHLLEKNAASHSTAQTIARFAIAYVTVWMIAAPMFVLVAAILQALFASHLWALLGVATLIAMGWRATPLRQVCLNGCHKEPPACPIAQRSDATGFRYGADIGSSCIGACWPLMLAAQAAHGEAHAPSMAIAALAMYCERLARPRAARWRWPL